MPAFWLTFFNTYYVQSYAGIMGHPYYTVAVFEVYHSQLLILTNLVTN